MTEAVAHPETSALDLESWAADVVSLAMKGGASDAEAVRMAIEMVIDHEETMGVARKVMKRHSQVLRELAAIDREPESDQGSSERKLAMPRSRDKTDSSTDLISQERSEREEALVASLGRGKVKNAGKRNNQ